MLRLDLMMLETPRRFQDMCFRLARAKFPETQALAFASWDGGRDMVQFMSLKKGGDIIWQCKFTKSLGSNTKKAVMESLARLDEHYHPKLDREHRAHLRTLRKSGVLPRARGRKVKKWILCLPAAATGKFRDWLRDQMEAKRLKWEIWDETELLLLLEKQPAVVEVFFYPVLEELQRYFQTEELKLDRLRLDKECQWKHVDPKVNWFAPTANVFSPDLVLDIILRNKGTEETYVAAIEAQVRESIPVLHGIPGDGLLFPQITYAISINGGAPGDYASDCEPPLLVRPKRVERFKVRLVMTGYSWTGFVRLVLKYGVQKELCLPWIRIST